MMLGLKGLQHKGLQHSVPSHKTTNAILPLAHLGAGTLLRPHKRGMRQACQAEPQQSVLDDDRLVRAMVGIGLNGSAAVGGAQLLGINVFEHFNFSEDFYTVALTGLGLLATYDTILFGLPWYKQLRPEVLDERSSGSSRAGGEESSSSRQGEESANNISGRVGVQKGSKAKPFKMQLSPALSTADSREQASWEMISATLALQQACIAATFTLTKPNVPLILDFGFIALRELGKELVQRGLLATFVTGWLLDRSFEAGIDDDILFYGQTFYLPDVVRYTAAFALTTLAIPAVLAEAEGLSLSVATNWAVLVNSKDSGEEEKDELLQEYALIESLQKVINSLPARLTLALNTMRGTLRYGVINFSFAYTNNLASSYTVAVASACLLSIYASKAKSDLQLTGSRPPPPN
ncbi:hypothetical protein DUNSADRAFT_5176 [Dunaliella salina]|uniref:Uncharacterized protein n=1 Tax=Dunaliella salina TaxID=3046 RepID=A0ABQ7H7J2_DUNSA|nr:hypothetical protein DUNSADRAFT_5176 [Dunaliella salina]|eukprot:KAF5842804.1 hypothetical protein DUNSADRAFT_5176 [Dunaliella salina]